MLTAVRNGSWRIWTEKNYLIYTVRCSVEELILDQIEAELKRESLETKDVTSLLAMVWTDTVIEKEEEVRAVKLETLNLMLRNRKELKRLLREWAERL